MLGWMVEADETDTVANSDGLMFEARFDRRDSVRIDFNSEQYTPRARKVATPNTAHQMQSARARLSRPSMAKPLATKRAQGPGVSRGSTSTDIISLITRTAPCRKGATSAWQGRRQIEKPAPRSNRHTAGPVTIPMIRRNQRKAPGDLRRAQCPDHAHVDQPRAAVRATTRAYP